MTEILYLAAAVLFILGLKQLSSPRTARRGNLLASGGMLLAIIVTLNDPTSSGSRPNFGTDDTGCHTVPSRLSRVTPSSPSRSSPGAAPPEDRAAGPPAPP